MLEIIKTYPTLFAATVLLPFFGGMIGAYIGWNSLVGKHEDENKERIVATGDKAISQGSRESYPSLVHIVENFGPKRNLAASERSRVVLHWSNMTSIKDYTLANEPEVSSKELINTLLIDSSHLNRARSAQLLSDRSENYVHEALLLSIFSDTHIEVMKESTLAYYKLVGIKNSDIYQPYVSWQYWNNNSDKIMSTRKKVNSVGTIPWSKLTGKIAMNSQVYEYLNYWFRTTLQMIERFRSDEQREFEQILNRVKQIENANKAG